MKRVLRYAIANNEQPHEVPYGVPVLFGRSRDHAAPGMEPFLDVWFEITVPGYDWDPVEYEPRKQRVQVVGTGDPVPDEWQWLASYYDDGLVWHLYRVS